MCTKDPDEQKMCPFTLEPSVDCRLRSAYTLKGLCPYTMEVCSLRTGNTLKPVPPTAFFSSPAVFTSWKTRALRV